MKKTRLITNKYCNDDGVSCPYLIYQIGAKCNCCKMGRWQLKKKTVGRHAIRTKRAKECIKAKFNAWVEVEK